MKAFPLILFLPSALSVLDVDQARKEGAALYLEENGDTTSASAVEREIAEGLGNQLLDILDLDDLPRPRRSRRDEKMTAFMSSFYEKMNEEEKKPTCSGGTCELHEWVEADGIVSLSPEKVEALSDGDTYKIRFPSKSIISSESPKTIVVGQLQIFIHGHQNTIKIWASQSQGFERAQVVIMNKEENHMKMNVTNMLTPWFKQQADTTLFLRIDNGGDSTSLITMDVFVMVAFKEASRSGPKKSRPKRNSVIQEPSTPPNSVPRRPRRLDLTLATNTNPLDGCRKQGLYVSFADLGWKEWLIAPEGYAAYFCGGACDFPLHNRMNATNHAIVQTLAHLVDPTRAQKSKCAPVQLSPMKILFVDNNQNVVMRRFRDMVVQECGCH